MPTPKLIPFDEFVDHLHHAALDEIAALPGFAVKSPGHLEEMRAHLINYYDAMTATHSFKDDQGRVWDCVPAEQQPALRRSGKPLMKPVPIPGRVPTKRPGKLHQSMLNRGGQDDEGNARRCPDGSVLIRRITLEEVTRFGTLRDFFRKAPYNPGQQPVGQPVGGAAAGDPTYGHRWAHAAQSVANIGGHSFLNVWAPVVTAPQVFSLSQHWYTAGQGDNTQTVEAGWQVCPTRYNTDSPCLFAYWTADYYHSTGAYNGTDGLFSIQPGSQWTLGEALQDVSIAGGDQVELEIAWYLNGGNWCLYVNGTAAENMVGYYPAAIYNNGPMETAADTIDYGGEVYGDQDWSAMGSGAFAAAGTGQAAYQRNILYYTQAGTFEAALDPVEQWPNCFTIAPFNNAGWGEYFYFGGPGGNNC